MTASVPLAQARARQRALRTAILHDDPVAVRAALAAGASPHVKFNESTYHPNELAIDHVLRSWVATSWALEEKQAMFEALLTAGALTPPTATHRLFAWAAAAYQQYTRTPSCYEQIATVVLKALIDQGAELGALNQEGATPLGWAMRQRNPVWAQALLAAGADPCQKDRAGQLPDATWRSYEDTIAEQLKAAQAQIQDRQHAAARAEQLAQAPEAPLHRRPRLRS